MPLLIVAIFAPLLLAIVVPMLARWFKSIHPGWFVLPLPILLFGYFSTFLSYTTKQEVVSQTMPWIPSLGIHLSVRVDGLGLLFALLISGIGALVVLYSIYYLAKGKEKLSHFYAYLLLFMGAMLGVVLSDNLIVLYGFWELTSFSSFLLIGYWYHRERSRYGAQKSMLITVFGGLALLSGIVLLFIMTGTFQISSMIPQVDSLTEHSLFIPALLCVLLGAFTKSAQFPFHIWLPDAMEAPTPVSAYLHSATMVKAGIYLVARMSPIFAESAVWLWLVAGVGIVTLFWGSFSAVKQTDLKAILAFSTVSQLGLIMSLLGVGAAALHFNGPGDNMYVVATTAAVFHLINHATFKGSLFMLVGIIDHETGTRDIRKLGGLMQIMPISFTLTMIGAFSMAGLPPFNGFLSKEMFFTAMVNMTSFELFSMQTWGFIFPIIAWLASIFTFVYSMKIIFKTFTGKRHVNKLPKTPHEAPVGMLISPVILGSLVILIAFFPDMIAHYLITPALAAILPSLLEEGYEFVVHIYFWHGPNLELFMTIGVILLGTFLYVRLVKWEGIYQLLPEKFTLNQLYDSVMERSQVGAHQLTRAIMNGSLRTYLIYIFSFMIASLGITFISRDAFQLNTTNVSEVGLYELVLAILMTITAVTILFVKSRLTSIILLGAVGYLVSLFFVLFRAPDLALTQLVIETVSVALFLLCFYHLPKFKKEETKLPFKLMNAFISIGVGTLVTLIALSAQSTKLFDSISSYYVENTYTLAAGKNMVNVILVDFRGFDTLFEICVLAIASLGIFAMIKLRLTRSREG